MQKELTDLFLQILQSSLWSEDIMIHLDVEQTKQIIALSEEQCLNGIVCKHLLDNNRLSGSEIIINTMADVVNIQGRNYYINNEICHFFNYLSNNGIKCLMVKGQVAAQWYSDPTVRVCGDVDFLVWYGDIKSTEKLISKAFNTEVCLDTFKKHSEFVINDVVYELHRDLLQFHYPEYSKYWKSILDKDDVTTIKVGNCDILTLSPTTNVLYVFTHMFFHLIGSGVSLRHMCDWMMCIHFYHKDIDYELLKMHLNNLGLTKAYLSAGSIMVDKLGLPQIEFGFPISASHRKQGKIILCDMMRMGNFGRKNVVINHKGLWHSLQTGYKIAVQSLKFIGLAPREIIVRWPHMVSIYFLSKLKNY